MKDLTGAEFVTSLRLERDEVQAFVEILEREQNALIQGEGEDLDFLASIKARMVKRLADFGERRNRYLASQGLARDSKGIAAWPAEGPRDTLAERPVAGTGAKARYPQAAGFTGNESARPTSTALWSDLLRLARIAQQLNQTNGAIIVTRLRDYQRAFAVLQGAAGTTALYGPEGQTLGIGGGRTLGFR